MRSYVATLIDRTNPDFPFTLASSLPTSCSQGVRFDNIVGGHTYTAQIDGYETFAADLCTVGCFNDDGTVDYKAQHSGSRHMESSNGTPVNPRWLGSCGEVETEPTIARIDGTTLILECDPLVDAGAGSSPTGVEVDPQATLGSLACAGGPAGESGVASFDIFSENGLGNLLGIPCNDAEPFVQAYTSAALVPGSGVSFFVAGHAEQGGPVTWGATCAALVKEGLTVRAACAPLSDKGSLAIDIAGVLDLYGVTCSGDIVAYDASFTGEAGEVEKLGVSCKNGLSFGPLSPGPYSANLVIHTKDGGDLFSASCSATVDPGRDAIADCTLQ